ncbi:MAG TPA: carboxylesterase/lipase family protein, partial [Polyangiales bacterium]|nr:carboxylesterase/lipase family protein [Polyangiales bacterium]
MTKRSRLGESACLLALVLISSACSDDKSSKPSGVTAADGGKDDDAGPNGDAASTRVTIADGALEGAIDGDTRKFLGIPYAKPPVDKLRFQLPQPNDKWTDVRDATQYGKRCAQLASTTLMNAASEDEDCLYLNVWTPTKASAKPLPVMIWIHGGGNVNGSASEPVPYLGSGYFYDGKSLSSKGTVVVTFNYRLGVFGFLPHSALANEKGSNPGNQGLFDQTQAMQWVHDNIAKFGGDPKNVTIFGESAGSLDVCFHVASPKSRGLFQHAISESGGCTTRNTTLTEGEKLADDYATGLGCTGDSALDCLRGKSVDELLAQPVSTTSTLGGSGFGPVVDGSFLPDQARTLYDKGDIAKVPYILGSNQDEGTLFLDPSLTLDTADDLTAAVKAQFPANYEDVLKQYPLSRFSDSDKPARAAYARILGDAVLVCSTYDSAQRAALQVPAVWMYNFDIPVTVAPDLGATHGSELVYVFNSAPMSTDQDTAASDLIENYWTAFATSGDPNG